MLYCKVIDTLKLKKKFRKIKNRCSPNWLGYGSKGVVCLWKNFDEFFQDMGKSYFEHVDKYGEKDTTIEKIDFNGNYCKENCKWATMKEQARNKSNTRYVFVNGKKEKLVDYLEKIDMNKSLFYKKIKRGYSEQQILSPK